MTPIYTARDDFVVGLEEDRTIFQVVEETRYSGLDIQGVEPKCEYTRLTLAFRIEIFDLCFLFFGYGIETWVVVE